MKDMKGFTLLELMIVIIIIGILAALAFPNFGPTKERTLEKESKVNLKLIHAAERIYRMENSFYYPYAPSGPVTADLAGINNYLKLAIPVSNNWNYKVVSNDFSSFSGRSQRTATPAVVWCVNQNSDDPTSCSW